MIELTKVQLQETINKLLEKDGGLTSVLEMALNGLMYAERADFLSENPLNKGNGYRKSLAVGMGKQISLNIPRDRLGMFSPMVIALIKDQKQLVEDLLFSNGILERKTTGIELLGCLYRCHSFKNQERNGKFRSLLCLNGN